jgi:prolyl-tRNA synthetase
LDTDVVLKTELADYAPVKGCMVIRPYGYALGKIYKKYLTPNSKERVIKT